MARLSPSERFLAKVDRNGPVPAHRPELGPCHVWIGARRDRAGYGDFRFQGTNHLAHRVAFYFAHGRWPEPCALHRCDNRACVNDAHLFEGTHAENMADMGAKGRAVNLRGELHANAKLTEQDVSDIRARYARGGVTHRELGQEFGVARQTISFVLCGRNWAHAV